MLGSLEFYYPILLKTSLRQSGQPYALYAESLDIYSSISQ